MRRRPVRYTLWLARTGASPKTLSIPVWVPVVLVLSLLAWSVVNVYLWNRSTQVRDLEVQLYSLSQQARKLSLQLELERNRNNTLSQEAQQVLQNLEALESQINTLRERVGLPKVRLVPAKQVSKEPAGGAAETPKLGDLLLSAHGQIRAYQNDLAEIEPELNRTLRREAATPGGYPIRGHYRITSHFGNRRNPFGWGYEFHNGIDFSAPTGTPVRVTAGGQVVQVGWNGPFGLSVTIEHGFGYRTLYGHLSSSAVKVGEWLEEGQMLGRVGSTGRSTGPHLHYSLFRYGVAVNPVPYLQ